MTRGEAHSTWPALDEAQQAQSAAVVAAVGDAVRAAGGWLSFAEYLQIVLYAPGLGYYSAGSAKFGRDGDFITAPELSPLFGRALARQCARLLLQMAGDAPAGARDTQSLQDAAVVAVAQTGNERAGAVLPPSVAAAVAAAQPGAAGSGAVRSSRDVTSAAGRADAGVAAASDTAAQATCVPFDLLEFGAGTGRLAEVLLTTLAEEGVLPRRYLILEVSADLRARQQARLVQLPAALRERVQWLSAWPQAPIEGLVIANEVADAVPFERFVKRAAGFDLRGVALAADGSLVEADRPAPAALQARLRELEAQLPEPLAEGYVSEVCPLLDGWMAGLAAVLGRGALLLFDYGLSRAHYYHPQRDQGTLRCHFRHRAHDDALRYPGVQDITAWVDFTRLAEAAVDQGLEVMNYCTQAAFLLANGIEADVAAAVDDVERVRLASQARQLLLPGEMGEIFKFMALGRDAPELAEVARIQDLRRLL